MECPIPIFLHTKREGLREDNPFWQHDKLASFHTKPHLKQPFHVLQNRLSSHLSTSLVKFCTYYKFFIQTCQHWKHIRISFSAPYVTVHSVLSNVSKSIKIALRWDFDLLNIRFRTYLAVNAKY